MKMYFIIVASTLFVFFSSCISDDRMKAAKEVTLLMGAEDFSVGVESSIGGTDLSTLRIKNFSDSGKGLSLNQITSFAAANFISKIRKGDFKDSDSLKIIIENDTGIGEVTYAVKDIRLVEKYYGNA